LKKVKDGDNIEEIKAKTNDLSSVIQKIGAEMYKQQGNQPGQAGPENQQQPPEGQKGPEEGEYKEQK